MRWDAIIVAGGAASRLGHASKPDVEIGGRRLLDRVLAATTDARRVVVVGDVAVPNGVLRTLESPPRGGPAAGVAAGLGALDDDAAEWVLLLACDLPRAAEAVNRLLESADPDDADADGFALLDDEGRAQWLLGLYRRSSLDTALRELGDPRDTSMRRLVGGLRLRLHASSDEIVGDVDTWDDAAMWNERLKESP